MVYYQIDEKVYYLNLDALFALIVDTPNNEKMVNTTITQYYGENDGKEIVETKSNLNETMNNVRYDFIKYLITCLFADRFSNDGSPLTISHFGELSLAQTLCLNTLIEYKIICEVETNE